MGQLVCGHCHQVLPNWDELIEHVGEHLKKGESVSVREQIGVLKTVNTNARAMSVSLN